MWNYLLHTSMGVTWVSFSSKSVTPPVGEGRGCLVGRIQAYNLKEYRGLLDLRERLELQQQLQFELLVQVLLGHLQL
jgi:hypothetical protein